ncbi:ABC transporter [Alkalihalobacillus alcalophilus ATCC 27647 = CGMCC 1.3604]|uniref:ABC transporter n=1 Tax=Alkalihalobacillus alcalophilus ATCC 27647 = CGMCC 1.3604 TaxID=1218173 RepID=J8TKT3_ALKAL|nr:ABC transporter ATP-binding protein [Alkalihalobacillus alcalophilus]AFV25998.1 branched-chain amino acid transporter [Alkalihalobacillus alcalophilus ATCC 27647 = CGMCC 1.3604]KGA95524.1 ABC transporter [Alkalihalobacillus alcalophilus ATCC 27647 = CGMCC 1.3604]MED1564011.1 ABC transporter ATP-binding protein [Alkalihalobacillus alcalophilus]THG91233.1 ABC transporter [Alkalihalobacillus alcalophilus ATCC 27647 = CGMCC 1.3604]
MLEVKDLHTYYGESHILHGVSLQVKESSVSILLGRNGMGKTTTIHSIIGLVPPKSGQVILSGEELQTKPSYQISKMGVGLVPQGRRIFPNLTVKENLLTTHRSVKGGWTINKIFELFPRLKERETSMGGNLSGGEQQMLSIGRALLTNPKVLLLDEPSEGLSPIMVKEVVNIIKQLKMSGLSMLLVEQNVSMALELADHVYVLNKGKVVFDGTAEEFSPTIRHDLLSLSS